MPKPKRNAKGHFVKGHHTTSHRASKSKAIVVRQASPVVIRESVTVSRPKKKHHGGKRHHAGGGGREPIKAKLEGAGWGGLFGYLETNKADLMAKIPTFGGIPKEAIIGAALHFTLAKKHKHADRAAAAGFTIAGYKFGLAGFKLSGDEY